MLMVWFASITFAQLKSEALDGWNTELDATIFPVIRTISAVINVVYLI